MWHIVRYPIATKKEYLKTKTQRIRLLCMTIHSILSISPPSPPTCNLVTKSCLVYLQPSPALASPSHQLLWAVHLTWTTAVVLSFGRMESPGDHCKLQMSGLHSQIFRYNWYRVNLAGVIPMCCHSWEPPAYKVLPSDSLHKPSCLQDDLHKYKSSPCANHSLPETFCSLGFHSFFSSHFSG